MKQAHALKISDLIQHLNRLREAGDLSYMDMIPAPVQKIEMPSVQFEEVKKNVLTVETAAAVEVSETVETEKNDSPVQNETVEEKITVESEKNDNFQENAEVIIEDAPLEPEAEVESISTVDGTQDEMNYINDVPPPDMMGDAEEIIDDIEPAAAVAAPVQIENTPPMVQEAETTKKAPEAGPMRVSVADNLAEKNKVLQNEGVQRILDIFGGELVDVHVDRKK